MTTTHVTASPAKLKDGSWGARTASAIEAALRALTAARGDYDATGRALRDAVDAAILPILDHITTATEMTHEGCRYEIRRISVTVAQHGSEGWRGYSGAGVEQVWALYVDGDLAVNERWSGYRCGQYVSEVDARHGGRRAMRRALAAAPILAAAITAHLISVAAADRAAIPV